MSARPSTTAWLFLVACYGIALLTTPVRAQVAAHWQATTLSAWASDGLCPGPAGEALSSAQTAGGRLTFGERRLSATVAGTGAVAGGRLRCSQRWSASVTAQASYRRRNTRFWVAYEQSNADGADTTVRQPGLVAGVERRIGSAIVAMSVGPRRDRTASQRIITSRPRAVPEVIVLLGGTAVQDSVYVADTVTRLGRSAIPDVGLTLSWARKALGVEAGAHFGMAGAMQRVDPLGTLRLTYDVSARLSAIAALTSRAALPTRDLPASQVVTVGVRIRGGHGGHRNDGTTAATATEFRVAPDTADRLTISIRAPRADRVEIAADFTRWLPSDLERVRGGWWQLRVRTPPGMHRISIRVDGGRWNAPPGLPPVHDEFGGTVGVLVVQ